MQSSDFRSLTAPQITGRKKLARGGHKSPAPPHKQPHQITIIMPMMPHPAMGALAHLMLLHHLRGQR